MSRKLVKRRKDASRSSTALPERFRDGADANEDFLAPKPESAHYLNRSVFSMIAAVGSKTDFHSHLDDDLSDSSDERDVDPTSSQEDVDEPPKDTGPGRRLPADFSGWPERDRMVQEMSRSLPRLKLRTGSPRRSASRGFGGRTGSTPDVKLADSRAQQPFSSQDPGTEDEEKDMSGKHGDDGQGKPSSALALRLMKIFELSEAEEVISGTAAS